MKYPKPIVMMPIADGGGGPTPPELTNMVRELFTKLDRIEEKISQKADRGEILFSQDHH